MARVEIDVVTKASGNLKQTVGDWTDLAAKLAIAQGAMQLVGDAAKRAYDALEQGAKAQAVAANFDKLTVSINQTSDAMLGKLRQATAGMADDTTLMANANALLTMGLADNADALAKHFEIVTKLKKPTDDIASAMENWALLMANQSIPRLDSFGISSGKVRDRIKELQAANEGMNRETAFTIATLEQAEIAMSKVADQTQGTAADLERLNTEWANITTGLKVMVAEGLTPAVSNLVSLIDQVKQIRQAAQESDGAMLSWAETLDRQMNPNIEAMAAAVEASTMEVISHQKAEELMRASIEQTSESITGLTADIEFQDYAYQGARGSIEMQNVALQQNKNDQDAAAVAAAELKAAQEEAAAAADAHARVLGGHFFEAITSAQTETKTLEQRLFEQAAQAGATDEALVLLAAATGNYTQEQIRAALEAAAMTAKINEVAAAVAAGDLTAQQAINTLKGFQAQLQASGNESTITAGKVNSLSGSVNNGAAQLYNMRNAALGAASAINNIPSGKTFTLTFKTKGSISVPGGTGGGGVPDAGIDVSTQGGGGGTGGTYQPPPPPPPPPSSGGGGGGGGGFQPLQHGGLITGGILGRDSVPAMLMPGERVLSVAQNRKFEEGKLGNNITIHMPINVGGGMGPSMGPDPQRLATAINQQAYDTLFRAFRRMGLAR